MGERYVKLMLSWLALVVLLSTATVSLAYAITPYTGAVIQNNESINCSVCSDNTSYIQVKEHNVFSQSPKIIAAGKGYYIDHPISYNSQTGQQTWIKNEAIGVSMKHEVSSAHNLSQTLEMSARDSSRQDEHWMAINGGVHMMVEEDVQEGKVSIGALQGGVTRNGQLPSATALRNPSLYLEEDYIGDFHIEKNMTLDVPILMLQRTYSWLPCCPEGYFDVPDHNRRYIGTESMFDYRR